MASTKKLSDIDHSLMALGGEWLLWRTAAVAITSNWLIVSIAVLVIVSSNEGNEQRNPIQRIIYYL